MNPFLGGLFSIVAIVGILFTLESTGTTDLGLKKFWSPKEVIASNQTAVVLSLRALEPGERVTLAKLWNQEQGTFNHKYMDKGAVAERAYLAKPQDVIGRVMAREKAPTQVFTERDFLPVGSPEGVLGLIPEGLVSLSIELKSVQGLDLLGFKDRFDLRIMIEANKQVKDRAEELLKSRSYSSEAQRMRIAAITQGPTQFLLVQDGIVIRPSREKNGPIVVALHKDDVDATIQALRAGDDIFCTAFTGRPGPGRKRIEQPTRNPLDEFNWILESSREVEKITGEESERFVIPVGK